MSARFRRLSDCSLPQEWSRNQGLEVRLARPLCVQHASLSAFVDIAEPECTEGSYECPSDAVAVVKGYRPHNRFSGFICCIQHPLFDSDDVERVVTTVAAALERKIV